MAPRPEFTIGIEEEYLITDSDTNDLVAVPDEQFIIECQKRIGDRAKNEYLQCQLEVGTQPQSTVAGVASELADLRKEVATAATQFGYSMIAASTHPFAKWRNQTHTRQQRYDMLRQDFGQNARRLLICGMHIHIGINDDDLRLDLMNQASYFLPHLLALTCSSPFWEGEDTSLASYRLTVFDSLPRTGLPDFLDSFAEYRRLVEHLVETKCLDDGSEIWWDIRPSNAFPTVEQRITDVCSLHEDAVTITAVFQSLLAFLYRLRSLNQRWRRYPRTLVNENRWRAQRYGMAQPLIDLGKTELVPFSELAEEIISLVSDDATEIGCHKELENMRKIVNRGNSADRQRFVYKQALDSGESHANALRRVTKHLSAEFLQGI